MPFFDALAKVFLCLFNDILPRSDKFPWTHYDDDLISVMFVTYVNSTLHPIYIHRNLYRR